MNVGFYLTRSHPDWMDYFVRSIRRSNPAAGIYQLTDDQSEPVPGVDVIRLHTESEVQDGGFDCIHRVSHFAALPGEWLFIDTDVIVQKDVTHVFHESFDVAPVDRLWIPESTGQWRAGGDPGYRNLYRYNAGVVFSRSQRFWLDMYAELLKQPALRTAWVGDQLLLSRMAVPGGSYNVKVLPGMTYNFPPESSSDPHIEHAAIVHYKGKQRKPFLLQRVKADA